jgi:uncharacterized protein (TIGR03663 family)
VSRSLRKRAARTGPALAIVVIAAATLAVRCIGLEYRPVHGDEANQAYKTGRLLETGRYVYDPRDHHGPTLYYFALAPLAAFGVHSMPEAETWMLRLVPAVFSAATLLLFLPLRRALPPGAGLCAALLLAVSPAFTFYSRYFIQETLLVFFTFAAIVFGWRYTQRASLLNAIALAVSLCLMHATKETAVLAFAAMALALGVTLCWRYGPRTALARVRAHVALRHAAIAIPAAAALSVTLFSGFFTNPRGPLDSVLTYASYFQRAGGAGIHDKPWLYYLSLLFYTKRGPGPAWSEAIVLVLAALGALIAFWRLSRVPRSGNAQGDPWFLRFLALYTLTLAALYSAVPYKTPWSLLSFYFGIVVLAGVCAARAIRLAPGGGRRGAIAAAFLVALAHLGLQSFRSETTYAADVRNPWVYAHTSTNLVELVRRVDELAAIHPAGRNLVIKIIEPDNDYWPLPWYLRRYPNVGYWNTLPADPDSDLIISSPRVGEELRGRLKNPYFGPAIYSLRPAVLRELYVPKDLWDAFMATRQTEAKIP